jgi:4-amino-4-deoxy-L-arabinose transferase-like glycosyltransferase
VGQRKFCSGVIPVYGRDLGHKICTACTSAPSRSGGVLDCSTVAPLPSSRPVSGGEVDNLIGYPRVTIPSFFERIWNTGRKPAAQPCVAWTARHRVALLLVSLIAVIVGWHIRPLAPLAGGDDATYLALSQSIRSGGYANVFLVTPTPHVKYPPGNPAWIAVVQTVAGDHLHAVQLANLLLLVGMAVLLGDAVRRMTSSWLGVVTAALIAWNPTLLALAGTMLSETLFAATTALAVWAAVRAGADAKNGRWVAVAGAAALLSCAVRLNGISIVLAVGAWLLAQHRWRARASYALLILIVGGGLVWWFIADNKPSSGSPTYLADVGVIAARAESGTAAVGRYLVRNAGEYAKRTLKIFDSEGVAGFRVDRLFLAMVAGIGIVSGVLTSWRTWPLLTLSIGSSYLILLGWPWADARLLAPAHPLLVCVWALGVCSLARASGRMVWPHTTVLVTGGIVAILSVYGAGWNSRNARCAGADWYDQSGCEGEGSRSLVQGARLAGKVLAPDAILASGKEPSVWLHSGRPVVPLAALIKNGKFVVSPSPAVPKWDAVLVMGFQYDGAYHRHLASIRAVCGDLHVLARTEPSALVLVRRPGGAANACTALDGHLKWMRNPKNRHPQQGIGSREETADGSKRVWGT